MNQLRQLLQSPEIAEARPFFIVTTLVLVLTAALTIFEAPDPMPLNRLPLFLLLLSIHIALHWLSGYAAARERWRVAYLLGQGILALALVLVSGQPGLALALYAALIAETLGLFGLTRLALAGVIYYVLLTVAGFYLLGGPQLLAEWATPITSTLTLLIIFMVLYRRQAEARTRSQSLLADLETAHMQLTDYAGQVEQLTLAAERQRMARELHDTLAQGVAGIVLQLEAANNHLENGRYPRAQTIILQTMSRARSTLADARAAIDDLRLDDRTLTELIQQQTERFTRATAIPCHLTLALPTEDDLPPQTAEHAERIISESLTNITRHAQAGSVWLSVTQTPAALHIEIRDDGRGFDPRTVDRAGHYGLLGIRERTRMVEGKFDITSKVGEGTTLFVTLPLGN